jgi:hypothetical protein
MAEVNVRRSKWCCALQNEKKPVTETGLNLLIQGTIEETVAIMPQSNM